MHNLLQWREVSGIRGHRLFKREIGAPHGSNQAKYTCAGKQPHGDVPGGIFHRAFFQLRAIDDANTGMHKAKQHVP